MGTRLRQTRLPRLLMMTDRHRLSDPVEAARSLPRGAGVIVRDTDLKPCARYALARALRGVTRRRGCALFIKDDVRLALFVRAEGVHWPEHRVHRIAGVRPRLARLLHTAAAHSIPALHRAERAGADAVLISPVFPTPSHPGAKALGPLRFGAMATQARLPVFALGGVTPQTARRLHAIPHHGVAGIGRFTG